VPGQTVLNWRQRILILGFRLLYNELAWTYDAVSWIVSLGRWHRWQRTALNYLPPQGRILEVGSGPGHLLVDLAQAGHHPVGLDLSVNMLRLASRRLGDHRLGVPLSRGQAEALPFKPRAFDAVVLTFPTPFVYDPSWIEQLLRVLRTPGRLIVVEKAAFTTTNPVAGCLEWLYRITGQRGPAPDLPGLLESSSLRAWRDEVEVDGTTVGLVLAERRSREARE
jgi:ubiquinone/menaquinone biosynthesis C-methylase UbiE